MFVCTLRNPNEVRGTAEYFGGIPVGKPDPEPYAAGCARLGLPPHEVAAIEDSAPGRLSARAAGLLVIAYDHLNEQVTDADLVIRDLSRLPALLKAAPLASIRPELARTGGA